MSSKYLLDLHAFDVEKRYKPSKHYVSFVLNLIFVKSQ
jgi:hypothetical protein